MRPDRIVVGEVRGEEALDMLQAMNTGHDGSLTTVHANSPRDAVSRLEVMVSLANSNMQLVSIRQQVASAVFVAPTEAATTVAIRGTMRAVGVDVKASNGLVGTLKDGDHVDIYGRIGTADTRFIKKVLTNVLVLKAQIGQIGFEVFGSTPEELGEFVKNQLVKTSRMVKDAGIEPE